MLNDPIVIVSAVRTPMGAFQGDLRNFAAPELGAAAIRAAQIGDAVNFVGNAQLFQQEDEARGACAGMVIEG